MTRDKVLVIRANSSTIFAFSLSFSQELALMLSMPWLLLEECDAYKFVIRLFLASIEDSEERDCGTSLCSP